MDNTKDRNIQATIVQDSLAPNGVRLTTFLLTYPTIIHQDILTHRTIYRMDIDQNIELDSNKSTNSNRAKPTKQTLYEVWSNPFCPTRFPKRATSMHSSQGYLTGWQHHLARFLWLKMRYLALSVVLLLMWTNVHKQIANRLLMPWLYTTLVMTAVDVWWEHFFMLRDHFMAQDEVQAVATLAHRTWWDTMPQNLEENEWHLPFVTEEEQMSYEEETCIALSVARCARTSYARSHNQMVEVSRTRPVNDDIELFTRLHKQVPEHAGPQEHQAQARGEDAGNYRSGTLIGWIQLRHHHEMQQRLTALRLCQQEHPAPV